MKIGVFDSGVGGESFISPLQNRFPDAEIVYVTDKINIPYGDKTPDELLRLAGPLVKQLAEEGCRVIVIACNTLSSNCIDELRGLVAVPLIAVEPMLELAADLSSTGTVAICATPATLKSARYCMRKTDLTDTCFVEPDCSSWAYMIEQSRANEIQIETIVNDVLDAKADVIVLGCTHYHWIEHEIRLATKGRAIVIQPTDRILLEVERRLRDSLQLE